MIFLVCGHFSLGKLNGNFPIVLQVKGITNIVKDSNAVVADNHSCFQEAFINNNTDGYAAWMFNRIVKNFTETMFPNPQYIGGQMFQMLFDIAPPNDIFA